MMSCYNVVLEESLLLTCHVRQVVKVMRENKFLREETDVLEARVDGLKLRVQSAEVELLLFRENTEKKESQLLAEMQILRDKLIHGAFSQVLSPPLIVQA